MIYIEEHWENKNIILTDRNNHHLHCFLKKILPYAIAIEVSGREAIIPWGVIARIELE